MKQIYIHYEKWEDFLNGMYDDSKKENEEYLVSMAKYVLSNNIIFYLSIENILKKWKNSVDVNLSNRNCNRRAWLGAAACNYLYGCPEYITRIAWSKISPQDQQKANHIAEIFIRKYEEKDKGVYKCLGAKMLF
jgi:hypothetical protein